MLAVFCLRLACGLTGALLVCPARDVNPRFFRTHYCIALGLTGVAAISLWQQAGPWLQMLLVASLGALFCGALIWSLDKAPGNRLILVAALVCLVTTLGEANRSMWPQTPVWPALATEYASAALLGTATTAMLMGHSYLNAPAMSIRPLQNLLTAFFATLALRAIVAGIGLVWWTRGHSIVNLEDEVVLWLIPRWLLGLGIPIVLGSMARLAAGIRSTQSATGILYVVVVLTFLGEVLSLVLFEQSGFFL
jgi:hypothetical protein